MIARTFAKCALAALALCVTGQARAQSLEFGPPYTITGGFQNPFGVAVDAAHGHVLVTDTRNRRIRWATISSLSATPAFQAFGFVANPAQSDALIDPQGIAVDAAGNVYVVDARKHQVNHYTWDAAGGNYIYDAAFTAATRNAVAGVAIESPRDVAVGPDGKVYLLDSGRKRILRADGPADADWEVFLSDASWSNPYGLAVAPDGRVYVADTGNHRILRYPASGAPAVFGRYGTGAAQLRYPRDVAVDVDGRMYVADTNNHRIVILGELGQHVFALGRAPTMGFLQKIALDADHHLFAVDSDHDALIAFLGADAPVPFDGWLRDYVGDSGAEPSDPTHALASPDILVRHDPDVDASALTGDLAAVPFEQPRYDRDNFVYVQVRNRGTQALNDAVVLLYWADPAGALSFPADWHDSGFFTGTAPADTGNRFEVPPIPSGGSLVLGPLRFRPPAPETAGLGSGQFTLGARLISPFDVAASAAGPAAVRGSNNVAIRPISVARGPFPTGDQNTLVVRVRYSDDPTPVPEAGTATRIAELGGWLDEVSWSTATIRPLFRGEITLPQTRAYYQANNRSLLIEMATDALDILLMGESTLLDGVSASAADDIGRVIIVTNDTAADIDKATTGSWPYATPAGVRYLTVSVQGMNNSTNAFAHGLGHQLDLLDLFAYPNVSFPRPFAAGWDSMAQPFNGVHPTVWSKQLATWVTERGANIVFIPRPARGTSYSTGSTPIPLYAQTNAAEGRNVAIALGLTPGVGTFTEETAFYFIEARARTGADSALPNAGVLMYYVNEGIPQGQGPVIVRDHAAGTATLADAALGVNDVETPAGTGITTRVLGAGTSGADYRISIDYIPPPTGYDVSMRTGDPAWTSPDIWVDNQSDGYDAESGRTPTDHGDVAIGAEENRIYARVTNAGPADAYDVEVAFFISEPYHTVGGEADFTFLKSVVIPHLPPGETVVYVTWTPTVDDPHTCVKVVLRRLLDDTNTANNSAQQNLAVEWSTSHSPYRPVELSFSIKNPDPLPQLVYFRADQVPAGWNADLVPSKAYLQPNESFVGTLRLAPPPDAPNCTQHDVYVTAWTPRAHTLVRLGGTTARVNLARGADIKMRVDVAACTDENLRRAREAYEKEAAGAASHPWMMTRGPSTAPAAADKLPSCSVIRTAACTDPVQANTDVIVRYRNPDGTVVYQKVRTDANGCFEDFHVTTEGGDWEATVMAPPGNCLSPVKVSSVVSVPGGPEAERPEQERIEPVVAKVRGTIKMRGAASAHCADCRRQTLDHALELVVPRSRALSAGRLVVEHLTTALSNGAVGVHSGAAALTLQDGTVVEGSVSGLTSANVLSRTNLSRLAVAAAVATGEIILDGQFRGVVTRGRNIGCRVVLHYVLALNSDAIQNGGQVAGRLVGVVSCPCAKRANLAPPKPPALPDGCVVAFAASGKGRFTQAVATTGSCDDKRRRTVVTGNSGASLSPQPGTDEAAAAYAASELHVTHWSSAHASDPTSAGRHRGEFELLGAGGARVRGVLEGITNMDVHGSRAITTGRTGHLEGALHGRVENGALTGCELHGMYSIAAMHGNDRLFAAADWQIRGAIVCGCKHDLKDTSAAVLAAPMAPPAERELADLDRNGRLDVTEASDLLAMKQKFAGLDADKDGRVSRGEFVDDAVRMAARMFLTMDRDHNGLLQGAELDSVPIAARRAQDRNQDSSLNREEFQEWVRSGVEAQFGRLAGKESASLSFERYFLGMPRAKSAGRTKEEAEGPRPRD